MAGGGRAKREAREAAERSDAEAARLANKREELQRQSDKEKRRSQRLLMRSIRASAGGFFDDNPDPDSELDSPASTGTTLGGNPRRFFDGQSGGFLGGLQRGMLR